MTDDPRDAEIARLKAELAARSEPAEVPGTDPPPLSHYLHLADGSVVDHTGAIPTHVAVGDKVIPVVAAYER